MALTSDTLARTVEFSIQQYLARMEGHEVNNLYDLVLKEVEQPLLACIMQYTGNNQSKTANLLGLNRGTLRQKLKKYGML